MAVMKLPQIGTLSIRYQTGTNASGDPIYSTRNYSGVKATSTDQDLFDVGQAIASVTKYMLVDIIRQDKSTLING